MNTRCVKCNLVFQDNKFTACRKCREILKREDVALDKVRVYRNNKYGFNGRNCLVCGKGLKLNYFYHKDCLEHKLVYVNEDYLYC